MKTILFPTDFSPFADLAFDLAVTFAEKFNARLLLLHVYSSSALSAGADDLQSPPDFHREALAAQLREYGRRCPLWAIEHLLIAGDRVADVILQVARERNCEAIVMGSHGRTGITRLFMGSVAEKVQRAADCPVAIVRRPLIDATPAVADASESHFECPIHNEV